MLFTDDQRCNFASFHHWSLAVVAIAGMALKRYNYIAILATNVDYKSIGESSFYLSINSSKYHDLIIADRTDWGQNTFRFSHSLYNLPVGVMAHIKNFDRVNGATLVDTSKDPDFVL